MTQQDRENPYEVLSDSEAGEAGAKNANPILRIVALATCGPIITLFFLSFFATLDIDRFTSNDFTNVVVFTSLAALIAAIALPATWGVSGFICRRTKLPTLSQQEILIFLSKWVAASVLLFATLPTVIEGFGSTYPISDYTINYFLLLALAMSFLVVTNFLSYRREPNQKSAFICCAGGIILILAIGMVGLYIFAIAASYAT